MKNILFRKYIKIFSWTTLLGIYFFSKEISDNLKVLRLFLLAGLAYFGIEGLLYSLKKGEKTSIIFKNFFEKRVGKKISKIFLRGKSSVWSSQVIL